ncbi:MULTISPECIES: cation:proton antiporter [Paraburkholderia]|uniref:cation:proton antiporter n=1 Tax=Paraburkholderia TaxID=1822464 RepID=UPI001CD2178F|nr:MULTISPECIES: cation:proton antiporter [Paraburkholderia]
MPLQIAIELTIRAGGLLLITALCHGLAHRLQFSDSFGLTGAGLFLGLCYLALQHFFPDFTASTVEPFLTPSFPPEAYLWLFLPPILFEAALKVDTRQLLRDLAPVLTLAIGAVAATAAAVGLAAWLTSGENLIVCLLLGAIVSTTDPSTVIALFRINRAPARLIKLVEGESLLNDAAAIAITTTVTGVLVLAPSTAHAVGHPLLGFLASLLGGCALGACAGSLFAWISQILRSPPFSEYALSLALPTLLYPAAELWLHVSGVAAVVCAGLAANWLMRACRPKASLIRFRHLWEHQAGLASAAVFLLASARAPDLLDKLRLHDVAILCLALAAAVASRFGILTICVPLLSRIGICKPLPRAHQLLIAWGGVRGPVTLTLALCVARESALSPETRHFAATMATGFVVLNLLCNGLTLGRLGRWLGVVRPARQGKQSVLDHP